MKRWLVLFLLFVHLVEVRAEVLGPEVTVPLGRGPVSLRPSLERALVVPKRGQSQACRAYLTTLGAVAPHPLGWVLRLSPFQTLDQWRNYAAFLRGHAAIEKVLPLFFQRGRTVVVLPRLAVGYREGTSAGEKVQLELQFGLFPQEVPTYASQWVLYQGKQDLFVTLELANSLSRHREVEKVYLLHYLPMGLRLVPNDTLYSQCWHLKNTTYPGEDVAAGLVEALWDQVKGRGQVIAILDGGTQIAHPDLQANVLANRCLDYADGDTDPTPSGTTSDDAHGTLVAGLAAALGNNNLGGLGLAFESSLVAYRLVGTSASTEDNFADALTRSLDVVTVHNNSWGPPDGQGDVAYLSPLLAQAIRRGIRTGRGGRGLVYVWSAGNGGNSDNANLDGLVSQRYVIAVGALDSQGKRAPYSERGTALLIVAPGGSSGAGLVASDLVGASGINAGDYTQTSDNVGGTSFSAPLVSAAVALILEANPSLSWRDVREVLLRSARRNDPTDGEWRQNGAGLWVHPSYGFGALDVYRAVQLARSWTPLPPEEESEWIFATTYANIPDGTGGISHEISVWEDLVIEGVEVFVQIDHPQWTTLRVRLISPSGSESLLLEPLSVSAASATLVWTFLSWHHYGERSRGVWRLVVEDLTTGQTGRWIQWGLRFFGRSPSAQAQWENQMLKRFARGASWENASSGCSLVPFHSSRGEGDWSGLILLLGWLVWMRRRSRSWKKRG